MCMYTSSVQRVSQMCFVGGFIKQICIKTLDGLRLEKYF